MTGHAARNFTVLATWSLLLARSARLEVPEQTSSWAPVRLVSQRISEAHIVTTPPAGIYLLRQMRQAVRSRGSVQFRIYADAFKLRVGHTFYRDVGDLDYRDHRMRGFTEEFRVDTYRRPRVFTRPLIVEVLAVERNAAGRRDHERWRCSLLTASRSA
jgi:hypothetical protein